MRIAFINKTKHGDLKIEFLKTNIFNILREELKFTYRRINNVGYVLKKNNGAYEISSFAEMSNSFKNFIIRDFDTFEFNREIGRDVIIEEWENQKPIKWSCTFEGILKRDINISEENLKNIVNKLPS